MQCVYCLIGRLRPTRLTLTFTYRRRVYPLADPDGLVCDQCSEAFISQRAVVTLRMAEAPCDVKRGRDATALAALASQDREAHKETIACSAPR
jgi:hypothetical protein